MENERCFSCPPLIGVPNCPKCGKPYKGYISPTNLSKGVSQITLDSLLKDNCKLSRKIWGEKDYWYKTKCTCGGAGIHASDDLHTPECAKVKAKRGSKYHIHQAVDILISGGSIQEYIDKTKI